MTSDWVIIDYPINFANEINILLDNFVYSEYDGMHYVITQFPPYSTSMTLRKSEVCLVGGM